jgi:hypothetical protein
MIGRVATPIAITPTYPATIDFPIARSQVGTDEDAPASANPRSYF